MQNNLLQPLLEFLVPPIPTKQEEKKTRHTHTLTVKDVILLQYVLQKGRGLSFKKCEARQQGPKTKAVRREAERASRPFNENYLHMIFITLMLNIHQLKIIYTHE